MGFFAHEQGYIANPGRPGSPALKPGDYSYAVFFRDERAGEINISREENLLNAEGSLSFFSFGQENIISFKGLAVLSETGEARDFIMRLTANEQEFSIRGAGHGRGMKISLASGSFRTSFVSAGGLSISDMAFTGLKPSGGDFNLPMKNPFTGRNEPVRVTFEGETKMNGLRLNEFTVRNRNLEYSVSTCSGGDMVMASVPPGFKFVEASLADKLFPREKNNFLPDIASGLSICSGIPVDSGRKIAKTVFTLSGLKAGEHDIASHRQEICSGKLFVRAERPPGEPFQVPAGSEKLLPYLQPEPLIEAGHPAVSEAASQITGRASCAWEGAKKINAWLFENIEKKYSPGIPSALATLESMSGDCNEHAFLFVALARSAGIPAKVCIGLAYHDGRFYYHAWPAVFAGQWVEMDPTLGLETVGAAHVKLIEGGIAEQMRLAGIAGSIRLELEEVRYDTDRSPD